MKHFVWVFISLFMMTTMQAQELKVIKLNTPDKTRGDAFMQVLANRKSDRTFSEKPLSQQDLSDLLWAANGVNRPNGMRTAPSAINAQEVDVYVILKEGAYLYDATAHALNPVATGDYRVAVAGGQDFAAVAPVSLVLVADLSRFGGKIGEQSQLMGAVDAGIVCQNINIACAGLGLVTVPRATMDQAVLKSVLKLKDTQLLLMNNPVGYSK
ncbi:FMN reductase [NAD(P)H] [Bacteroidales bacterium Barb6]|nr:FMN reductase [NAD(P)H] [Bacteroidales bacterium Barb6]